jgi:cellulose synthase/poly-beta-1,6-N-acetylglucosamine synthase-like glycosyltransferase
MIVFLIFVLLVYLVTVAQLIYGFCKIKTFHPTHLQQKTFFAIVIPFRNESDNLPILLESVRNLNYPEDLFEIILVDDDSQDDSVRKFYNWRMENGKFQTTLLENIRLSDSPKKDAIGRAIPIIKNDWIVTTDADCVLPPNWLLTIDNYIQRHEVSMLVGLVVYECRKYSFLHQFQRLDFSSLQGTTIGSFGMGIGFMCNGANFAYRKSLFEKLGGFKGNDQTASGDDVFLLQKAMQKCPEQVHYLKAKSTIVKTKPMDSWDSLFQQRVRWASKTGSYESVFAKDLAIIVLVCNLSLLLSLASCVSGFMPLPLLGSLFLAKFIFDFILLYKTNRFLYHKRMRFVILGSLLYPFFCVAVALSAVSGSYQWKGRNFKS